MQGRLRNAYEPASSFVQASGNIDCRTYQSVLRAKRLVTIKGAGATYSGLFYVTRVRHRFTLDGYSQDFEARRNGLGLTGEEEFQAPLLPIAVVPGLGGSTAATGTSSARSSGS